MNVKSEPLENDSEESLSFSGSRCANIADKTCTTEFIDVNRFLDSDVKIKSEPFELQECKTGNVLENVCVTRIKEEICDVINESKSKNCTENIDCVRGTGREIIGIMSEPESENVSGSSEYLKEIKVQVNNVRQQNVDINSKLAKCDICRRTFPSLEDFRTHLEIHTKAKSELAVSGLSENASDSEEGYLTDPLLIPGIKSFVCRQCGKLFSYRSDFVVHMRTHTGEKPFSCEACGKSFNQKSNLTTHMRVHTGEKPHICKECGKSFAQKVHLSEHIMSHTGETPYVCHECGKPFFQKCHFDQHMKVHTGERPFPCKECGKSFAHKAGLIRHIRVHTGEKPFECKVCGSFFAQTSDLIKHKRTHTGEKPYGCRECGKSFSRKGDLIIHERIHTGEKPFVCAVCGKSCSHKGNLVKHMKVHAR